MEASIGRIGQRLLPDDLQVKRDRESSRPPAAPHLRLCLLARNCWLGLSMFCASAVARVHRWSLLMVLTVVCGPAGTFWTRLVPVSQCPLS